MTEYFDTSCRLRLTLILLLLTLYNTYLVVGIDGVKDHFGDLTTFANLGLLSQNVTSGTQLC